MYVRTYSLEGGMLLWGGEAKVKIDKPKTGKYAKPESPLECALLSLTSPEPL